MWNMKIFRAKRVLKRIESMKKSRSGMFTLANKMKGAIVRDKKLLQSILNDMTPEEFFSFGVKTGYIFPIDDVSYRKDKNEMEQK